jgi:TPR repeat protein
VDAWKLKLEEEEKVAVMLRLAEAGNGGAMFILGLWYWLGQKGLAKDLAKAFEWYKKSHEAGNASGTGCLGLFYLRGNGVPECQSRANTLLSDAAARGSKYACHKLGQSYANGLAGFPKDEPMARRYYSMVASASLDDCDDDSKEEAVKWLSEHPAA